MSTPTVEELRRWFDSLDLWQRTCRVMVRRDGNTMICGCEAVGIDRLGGKNALVCEAHKPREQWFIRLSPSTRPQ